jgi:uncharacterized protein
MHIVVTGATGFVGRSLCAALLADGHELTVLSRDAGKAKQTFGGKVNAAAWGNGSDAALDGADAVIHLAGESVAGGRWTPEFKRKIRDSRVKTSRQLVEGIEKAARRPSVIVSASAVGFYGDRGDETITEASSAGTGFLPEVCQEWEAEVQNAEAFGVRVALMRIGIVLGKSGALEKILYPLPVPVSPWKLGLGGRLGSGRQWMPWIHLEDVVAMFLWAMSNPNISRAVNTTAPEPVRNAEFTRILGRVLQRPAIIPVPAIALKVMLGEFADTVLNGQKALPTVAENQGYTFRHRSLECALKSLLPF